MSRRGLLVFFLFLVGLFIVFSYPHSRPLLVVGGLLLFGSVGLVCAIERGVSKADGEPMIEGTFQPTQKVSEAYHTAIYLGQENPGAVSMIEVGEQMVSEGERLIRDGDYEGGLKKVQAGERRINKGENLLGRKGGKKA